MHMRRLVYSICVATTATKTTERRALRFHLEILEFLLIDWDERVGHWQVAGFLLGYVGSSEEVQIHKGSQHTSGDWASPVDRSRLASGECSCGYHFCCFQSQRRWQE